MTQLVMGSQLHLIASLLVNSWIYVSSTNSPEGSFFKNKAPLWVDKDHLVCDENYQLIHVERKEDDTKIRRDINMITQKQTTSELYAFCHMMLYSFWSSLAQSVPQKLQSVVTGLDCWTGLLDICFKPCNKVDILFYYPFHSNGVNRSRQQISLLKESNRCSTRLCSTNIRR